MNAINPQRIDDPRTEILFESNMYMSFSGMLHFIPEADPPRKSLLITPDKATTEIP